MKNEKNDSPGVRRGMECPGCKLRHWDPEVVFWSLSLGMSFVMSVPSHSNVFSVTSFCC